MNQHAVTHVYRWDLDKTYLDTDFESLRGLARAATESPAAKTNVPGSASLLRALALERPERVPWVAIVSGSPKQMRPVLEEKLRLDGVRWNELHLKNTLGQLRRGRIRAVRAQLGYKLPRILRSRAKLAASSREICFGDDAESDALIYALYAAVVAGEVETDQLTRLLKLGGVYEDTSAEILSEVTSLSRADAVDLVFIYLARPSAPERFRMLGNRVIPIHSYLQAAFVLGHHGQLDPHQVVEVLRATMGPGQSKAAERVAWECQDLVRRGHLPRMYPEQLVRQLRETDAYEADIDLFASCSEVLARLSPNTTFHPPSPPTDPDWEHIVRAWTR